MNKFYNFIKIYFVINSLILNLSFNIAIEAVNVHHLKENKMNSTTFVFVRHGETDDVKNPNWGSASETPLNENGLREAENASQEINALQLEFDDAFRTSTQRTKETAEKILMTNWTIDDRFAEMRLGNLPDLTPKGIIRTFCNETGYPHPKTKETLPRLWEALNDDVEEGKPGKPFDDANLCYYDAWRDDADTFQGYSEKFLRYVREIASSKKGKTVIVVCHSTGLKSIYAEAIKSQGINRPLTSFKPLTGGWVHIQVDSEGRIILKNAKNILHK